MSRGYKSNGGTGGARPRTIQREQRRSSSSRMEQRRSRRRRRRRKEEEQTDKIREPLTEVRE